MEKEKKKFDANSNQSQGQTWYPWLSLGNVSGGIWENYVRPSRSSATQRNSKIYNLNLNMNVSLPSSLPMLT